MRAEFEIQPKAELELKLELGLELKPEPELGPELELESELEACLASIGAALQNIPVPFWTLAHAQRSPPLRSTAPGHGPARRKTGTQRNGATHL